MWGALSDERTGLSFTSAAGPRQCSHCRVRVPWDSWPYFAVSDSRLPLRRLLRLAGLGSDSLGITFYKIPENLIEVTASKGSIPALCRIRL
jgi:hypothetical protein